MGCSDEQPLFIWSFSHRQGGAYEAKRTGKMEIILSLVPVIGNPGKLIPAPHPGVPYITSSLFFRLQLRVAQIALYDRISPRNIFRDAVIV